MRQREREKASENFVLWKFSWNFEWQLMMSRVGHACARRSDSLWNPEKLLEENWSKGKKGMESCQSNWPWLDSFGWLPCAIQLRMTMYLILLERQKRWGSRPRAQFQLPEKKRKGQTTTQHKNADQRLPLFLCFPSPVSTNDNITIFKFNQIQVMIRNQICILLL